MEMFYRIIEYSQKNQIQFLGPTFFTTFLKCYYKIPKINGFN